MEETRPLRPSPRALLLDDTIPSKEQSCYETIHQRVKDVFCPVEHPIPVPAGQRYDQLRPGAVALWGDRLRPADGAAFLTLITPPRWYQKTSGLRSLSNSLVTILNPILATGVFAFAGMDGVIFLDLLTFGVAFLALLLGVRLPQGGKGAGVSREPFWTTVRSGLGYLGENRMIFLLPLWWAACCAWCCRRPKTASG